MTVAGGVGANQDDVKSIPYSRKPSQLHPDKSKLTVVLPGPDIGVESPPKPDQARSG
jgi:hypothetical protein